MYTRKFIISRGLKSSKKNVLLKRLHRICSYVTFYMYCTIYNRFAGKRTWIKKIFGMPEAKISLFREIQCAKEWQRFLRRTFLKLSQLLSHRCLSFRRYRGDIVASCTIPADCLPNDKSAVFCLHNRLSNKIFQIQLDLPFFL